MPIVLDNALNTAEANARALLLACLQPPAQQQDVAAAAARMDDACWPRFVALATGQRVRPLVRQALTRHGIRDAHPSIADGLDQDCRRIAMRMLIKRAELARILKDFIAADIPVIVLKGACLSDLAYSDIALRELHDLDLLVPRERLQAAIDVMLARQYEPFQPVSVEADTSVMHHVPPLVKGVVTVELHWNITLPRQPYSIDPEELWPRAVPMLVGGVPALRLSLEDLLLHLCHHTSYHHQFEGGLRPSCDIAAVTRRYHDQLDWNALCERSARWRWSRGVFVALALARRLVGAEVPADVLSRLQGSVDDEAVASADRLLWTTETARELSGFAPWVAAYGGAQTSWAQRIRRAAASLVPPLAELARIYTIEPTNRWLPLFYLRRPWDLLQRHAPSALDIAAGRDSDLLALAAQRDMMKQWLLES